jgi:hypothetical protein
MTLKKGDWVTAGGSAIIGCVKRLARDGSWADVDWHSHTKRMQTKTLTIQHTIPFAPLGEGWTVTDETRRAELEQEVIHAG